MNYELKWLKTGVPLALAVGILWWMYRGIGWEELVDALSHKMSWAWMLLSMPFGVSAQVFRAMRWRQVLAPAGERPRLSTCVHAVFLSYASSLVVPRVGEVLRCGVLKRYDGTDFGTSLGTVVTERFIDSLLVLLLSLLTLLTQIPVFRTFFHETGVSMANGQWSIVNFIGNFSTAGWVVTAVCGLLAVVAAVVLLRRIRLSSKLVEGLLSVRKVENPWLFVAYSLGIWASYYLHFYLTFFCFDFTSQLGGAAALVSFVVGTYAVLVPTPNGLGSWHFAVKTVLVLYGVGQTEAALFVLIVHTIQTLLVALLGVYSSALLALRKTQASR